jgi:hypothetical protein
MEPTIMLVIKWNDIASSAIFTVKPGETIVLWEHSLDSKKNNHGFGVTKSKKIKI